MQPEDDKPMPALWGYVQKVYAKMEDQADIEETDDEETGLVYTGHLTNLFQGMEIPNPYYTSVTRALKAMGCLVQMRRGGGSSMSKWLLVAPPTPEAFTSADLGNKTGRAHKGKTAILEQMMRDLSKRVTALEEWAKAS